MTILRTGMTRAAATRIHQPEEHLEGEGTGAKNHRVDLEPARQLQGQQQHQHGGHVKTSCYDSWSTTIANFAGAQGFYAMSIGNEPDFASCGTADPCNGNYPTTLFTANEMVAWVKVVGTEAAGKGRQGDRARSVGMGAHLVQQVGRAQSWRP